MGAEFVDQAIAALGVAERDQALGEKLHPHRWAIVLRQFLGQAAPAASSSGISSPIGVPGPVWVKSSFCSCLSMVLVRNDYPWKE